VWTSCAIDEGRSLEIGFQEQVSNHSKLLRSRVVVVSVWSKSASLEFVQVSIRETNESEPFEDASLIIQVSSKPGTCSDPGKSLSGA
jgi:hypothetical protein